MFLVYHIVASTGCSMSPIGNHMSRNDTDILKKDLSISCILRMKKFIVSTLFF